MALPPDTELVAFSRWITPPELSIRFDTWSYLAIAPTGASPQVDGSEIVDFRWLEPAQALMQFEAGELVLAFPTRTQLEQLSEFESADALLAHARGRAIEPIKPHVVGTGEHARIMLPATRHARHDDSRVHPQPGIAAARQSDSSSAITCSTALISARCVNACG